MCSHLSASEILVGTQFRQPEGLRLLRNSALDYIIGIHFPYITPESVLSIPRRGVLNLHPAYLPYNRGWHTPSWALLDKTPIGATLHFMDGGVDTGDIVHRRALAPTPSDTANTLYQRLKQLEFEVFKEAWPQIVAETFKRLPQDPTSGTAHQRQDLFSPDVQQIMLDAQVEAGQLIRKLRALTTDRTSEAAYYEVDGRRYRIQVTISEEGK
jgi:methionyl-tRNA formyltransferase